MARTHVRFSIRKEEKKEQGCQRNPFTLSPSTAVRLSASRVLVSISLSLSLSLSLKQPFVPLLPLDCCTHAACLSQSQTR